MSVHSLVATCTSRAWNRRAIERNRWTCRSSQTWIYCLQGQLSSQVRLRQMIAVVRGKKSELM